MGACASVLVADEPGEGEIPPADDDMPGLAL
jgi:hypothetical protein